MAQEATEGFDRYDNVVNHQSLSLQSADVSPLPQIWETCPSGEKATVFESVLEV